MELGSILNVFLLHFQGPLKLPFIGGLPYFYKRKSLIHNIKDLVEEHGPICGVFLGSRKVVVIADLDILKGLVRFVLVRLESFS